MKHLLPFVILMSSGCMQGPGTQAQLDPYAALPGQWGWEGSDDCKVSPEHIVFSEDRKQMRLTHAPAKEDGTRELLREVTYQVLHPIPNGLSLAMGGEARLDASGKPVTWDLILLDHDQYCWHRNDWRPTACTKSVRRCGRQGP